MTNQKRLMLGFFGGFCGGAERMMLELHSILKKDGFSVPLVFRDNGAVSDSLQGVSEPAIHLYPKGFANKWFPFPYLAMIAQMTAFILRCKPDAILVEGKLLTQIAVPAARFTKTPVVSYLHYPPSDYELKRACYAQADELLLCCDGLQQYVSKLPTSTTVIRNFVSCDTFTPVQKSRQADLKRELFQIEADQLLISLVGHLSPVKGQTVLLDALVELRRAGHAPVAALVGADNHPQKQNENLLRQKITELGLADQVLLTGKIAEPQQVYQASDIFVLPSRKEGLPLVVLEAMACGVPVVATAIDGTPEAVIDGETGFLIGPDDAASLANQLKSLIESPFLRDKLGMAGRQRVEQLFTKDRWAAEFLAFSRTLCSQ